MLCCLTRQKCTDYEVEDINPRGSPKTTIKEVVEEDLKGLKLNKLVANVAIVIINSQTKKNTALITFCILLVKAVSF